VKFASEFGQILRKQSERLAKSAVHGEADAEQGIQRSLFNELEPSRKAKSVTKEVLPVAAPGLRLAYSRDHLGSRAGCQQQLCFVWAQARESNVVSMPSRRAVRWLDYGVFDMLRDCGPARAAAIELEENGVYLLGQLVQLTRDDISLLRHVTDPGIDAIEAELATMGLRLGMNIPSWTRQACMPSLLQ